MATTDAKIVAVDDLHPDSLVVRPDGKVGLKVFKDVIYTHGVLAMDDEGRLVMRDALVVMQPATAVNLGQLNLMTPDLIGIGSQFTNTNHARYYVLSFGLTNFPRTLRGGMLWLNRVNGSETLTPVKWVEVDGSDAATPDGVEVVEDGGSLRITIKDAVNFNSATAGKYLVFKHSDDTQDYDSAYGGFEDDVRQGLRQGSDRWRFEPDVDITKADWPKAYATDLSDLAQRAYTFKVYG